MHNTYQSKDLYSESIKEHYNSTKKTKNPPKTDKGFEKTFNERRYTNDQEAP